MSELWLFLAGIYVGGCIVAAIAAHMSQVEEDELVFDLVMIFLWFITLPIILIADAWDRYQSLKKGSPNDN